MANFDVVARLKADTSNFSSGLQRAQSGLSGLVKSVAGGMGGIGKSMFLANLASNAVSKGFSMVTSGMSGLIGEMDESNKSWKTFEGNMKMLGKSSGEIDQVKSSLQDFAEKSIYSASDMAQTYAQMAAIGVKDTEKLVKGMGGIAAASENPKQAMKTLSTQMTQALTKPTMTWADFKLMLEQSPAGMSAVAKQMGMSLDELVQKIQDGEVSSKDFAAAVAEVGTNESFSRMATEAKTTGQAIDGLREGLANKLMPAFQALDKIGIQAVKSIGKALDKVNFDGLKDKIMQARLAVVSFFKGFNQTGAMSALKQAFSSIGSAVKNVISAFTGAKTSSIDLGRSFGKLVEKIANVASKIANFVAKLDPGAIKAFAKGVLGVVLAFKMLKTALDIKSFFDKLKMPANPLKALTDGLIKDKSKVAQIIQSIGTLFKDLGSGIGKAAQGIGTGISTVFKGLGQGISTAAQGIGKGLSTIFMGIGRMTQVMNPVNMLAFAAAIAIVVASLALLATQSEGVAQILQALGSAISEIVVALGTAIGGIVESLGSALAQVAIAIGQAVANIITAVTPLVSVVGGIFVQLAGIVANAIVQIVQAIAPFIPAITEMVTAVVSQIPNIITAFAGLVTAVGNSISQIIQSVTGLISAIGPVLESAGQMFKDLGEGIKTALEGAQGVLEGFGTIIETVFSGASQVIETFGDTVTRIMDSVRGIIQEIGDTATKIGESFQTMSDALIALNQVDVAGLGASFITFGAGLAAVKGADPQTIATGLTGISTAIGTIFRVSALATDFQALGSALSGFPDTQTIATGLSAIGTALGTIFRVSALATDFAALKTALTGLGTFATQAGQGLTQLGTSATQLGSTMTTLKSTFTTSLTSMQTTATTVLNSIKSTFTSGMNSIKSTVTSGLNTVKSTFTSSFNSIQSTVRSSMNSTLSTVRSTMSSVVSAMNGAAGQARSAGYNMGVGFYNGLSSMAGSIISLAYSIASRAAAVMRSALRVHSPSKVTTKIGEYTGEGLGNGIANMRGYVERMATKLAGYAVPDISANDITGRMNALTTKQLDAGYQFSAGTLTVNQQPATIALNLGGTEYRAFVDDITDVQNKSADLRLAY